MIGFWLAVALAVLLVLAWLFRPFLMKSTAGGVSRKQLNASIYRDQLAKLERDRADNMIADADYTAARAELQRRVIDDTQVADDAATLKAPKKTMAFIGLALPIAAIALYMALGKPATLDPNGPQRPVTAQDVETMVQNLAQKLEKDPSNLQGWVMLARSYKMLGRPMDAEKAFEHAGTFLDNDAQLLAIYADVAATNANGSFAGKPLQLIEKALRVDPKNAMALWLAGTAAYRGKQFNEAIRIWERLTSEVEPGSEDARMLQEAIEAAYGAMGKTAPAMVAKAAAAPPAKGDGSAPAASVSGVVELDASLKARAAPTDTVMVIARAPGMRMPLAVLRTPVSQWPLKFSLDDSLSMSPQARISGATEVEIQARISKTGMAQPEPGDLISKVQTVKVGASGLKLLVNEVRQ